MKKILSKSYITLFFLLASFAVFADTVTPGTDDDTATLENTDAPAPIGDYVWILALLGILFAFMMFRSIQNKKIKG